MSDCRFIEFWSLLNDVVYTVKTVQRVYNDSLGYFYRITVVDPDESTYYMTIVPYSLERAIHDRLEKNRKRGVNKKFTFTKTTIETKPDIHRMCIMIEDDVVELE